MPSKSPAQRRLMAAAAHSRSFAKKFNRADVRAKGRRKK